MKNKLIISLMFLLYVSSTYAVKFHSYVNEKGETVFSNIPQKCVQAATLTCLEMHPALSMKPAKTRTSDRSGLKSGPVAKRSTGQSRSRTTANAQAGSQSAGTPISSAFNILDNIVEMNHLMNEYYPASADPADTAKVRAQQEDILDVLQIIKGASSNKEQGTIEKAINILRSNLVQ